MNKSALITGAASGIGYELALLLANDEYNLILVDKDRVKLDEAKLNIYKMYNSQIITLVKDLSKPNSAQETYNEIKNIPIDVLINNAGFGVFGAFSDTNWARESEMLCLHTHTTTHLTKLILSGMINRNSGKILNLASLAAFQPGPLMAIYYATKAYILSFSEAIANELKGTGVSITVLCPGQTKTKFQSVVSSDCSPNGNNFKMACPKEVAKYGYDALLEGKTVAIPGRVNRLISLLPRIMPRNTAASIVRRIQEKNRHHTLQNSKT